MKKVKHLVLGHGYVAKALIDYIKTREGLCSIQTTSRTLTDCLHFNLDLEKTWGNLPKSKNTYWMFPAQPLSMVQRFFESEGSRLGKLVVVGSTGGFQTFKENGEVTETSPLDESLPRVLGETFLKNHGACVVCSAGIYGRDRNPLAWIKRGLVGRSEKLANMIHVEDLAQVLYQAAKVGRQGSLYIAADGNPQQWSKVIDKWVDSGVVENPPLKPSARPSKLVNPKASLKELDVHLKYKNFAETVLRLPV